ncbi:bifunctional 2',3'-cyclic-nucleotide 2'-phosphodiesterase/3'-nucleotidase [Granulosicoccus antarcticus]|uniref:Trifunctional nucleotide phosphoesterase protein YfkN n=1 Tax=Granulosicoccus antarcticus IMCC3135 TaxID=1192854 RepID=A0A2Z2P1K5_9GAMM|nr:bifunctional 2',3'-cyclic-nucleotide 2'-phosphodiesterase/3'-nucleotidase [Granulosicoccus antarcticus]ASJ74337.1 Trifunctional nucleotide phosphoesterase protein YfkN [Granulosicoccus antarcticus IMCC3135]
MNRSTTRVTAKPFLLVPLLACGLFASAQAAELDLRLMQTTDLHMHAMNYDYYRDTEVDDFGLARTATLIRDARAEARNSLLFDNGDLIQGNPMGDYMARAKGLSYGDVHPMFKAMNLLQYDAANVGNHEFNYGLEFLLKSLSGANFPYVLSNVYAVDGDDDPSNDRQYIQPYVMLERRLMDSEGQWHDLKVGVIGFTPPQIMSWDKGNLEGRVTVRGIVETAEALVPKMREEGADLVIAIAHSGIATSHPDGLRENATAELAQVDGIDAIMFGHAHSVFPSEAYEDFPGADLENGTLHGVPAVMPGFWGSHLGIIDLTLSGEDGNWQVSGSQVENRAIYRREGRENIPVVGSQQDIIDAVSSEHAGTIEWVGQAVGSITSPINSFFALVQDDPSIQIVNNAQTWYGKQLIEGTEYGELPVLSAGAPFKAGGRGGPDYYTNLPAGEIAIRNVADLYIYPNTARLVKLNGAQVREWLERSAVQFNTIDPASTEQQALVSETHPSYNFDVIDGVSYLIDVTQPPRYSDKGELLDENAHRIVDLSFNGSPIDAEQEFVVVTNNYRAGGGGGFPALDGSTIIVEAPQTNRQALVDYILASGELDPQADNNWGFAPINGEVQVVFDTSPTASDASNAQRFDYLEMLDSGFARYRIPMGE